MANGPAKEFHKREFLNPTNGMAAIEAKVQYYHPNFVYANFAVSDCNKVVNLDFDFSNKEEKADRLYKIEMLIAQLSKFKEEAFV